MQIITETAVRMKTETDHFSQNHRQSKRLNKTDVLVFKTLKTCLKISGDSLMYPEKFHTFLILHIEEKTITFQQ